MTKPLSGGAGRDMPVDGAAFAYQVRSRRVAAGVIVEAYGGPPQPHRKLWLDLWPDGWCVQETDRDGGAMIGEGLTDKLAAVDVMMRDLLENGGVGVIDDQPCSGGDE